MTDRSTFKDRAFEVWTRIPFDSTEGRLSESPIEPLLLQLERKNFSGLLSLESSNRQNAIRFHKGGIVSLKGKALEPRNGASWLPVEICEHVLSWRSGTFQIRSESKEDIGGTTISPQALLKDAWNFCFETIPADFFGDSSESENHAGLYRLRLARTESQTGELLIRLGENACSYYLSRGTIDSVLAGTGEGMIADLAVSYGLLSKEVVSKLAENRKASNPSLADLAVQTGALDVLTVDFLKVLRIWDCLWDCVGWPNSQVEWKEIIQSIRLSAQQLGGTRCSTCGAELTGDQQVCTNCSNNSFGIVAPDSVTSKALSWHSLRKPLIGTIAFFAAYLGLKFVVPFVRNFQLTGTSPTNTSDLIFKKIAKEESIQRRSGESATSSPALVAPRVSAALSYFEASFLANNQSKKGLRNSSLIFQKVESGVSTKSNAPSAAIRVINTGQVREMAMLWSDTTDKHNATPMESWGSGIWGIRVPAGLDPNTTHIFFRAVDENGQTNQSAAFILWQVMVPFE